VSEYYVGFVGLDMIGNSTPIHLSMTHEEEEPTLSQIKGFFKEIEGHNPSQKTHKKDKLIAY
jgi:hypothetical protein